MWSLRKMNQFQIIVAGTHPCDNIVRAPFPMRVAPHAIQVQLRTSTLLLHGSAPYAQLFHATFLSGIIVKD